MASTPSLKFNEEELRRLCEEDWYQSVCGPSSPVVRLNHGSFGCAPKSVKQERDNFRNEWEKQPDAFYYHRLPLLTSQTREVIANSLNVENKDCIALMDNVTQAMSVISNHLTWEFWEGKRQKGDAVIVFEWTYGAVTKCFQGTIGRLGGKIVQVPLSLPIQKEDVIEALKKTIEEVEKTGKIAMVVLDHINSPTGMVFPLTEMISLCRAHNVGRVVVDGAHAFGQAPIDLSTLDCDFYTSNIHKWGLAPVSVAFLYISPSLLPTVGHSMISHNFEQGIGRESQWVGTKDYSPMITVPKCIEFFNDLGGIDAVVHRNRQLALQGRDLLISGWGVEASLASPPDMTGSMFLVPLPSSLSIKTQASGVVFRSFIREKYKIEVVVISEGGRGYVRVSCPIYVNLNDLEKLRDCVLDIVKKDNFKPEEDQDCVKMMDILESKDYAPPGSYIKETN